MTTYYLSTYALSTGIREIDARLSINGRYAITSHAAYALGDEAHETREAAVAAAEAARIKKIASLRKQLAKLEALEIK